MADQLEVGTKLQAKFSDGSFYAAEVLTTSAAKKRSKAPVKVRYSGYGEECDAWVALEDLKSKKLSLEAKPEAKSKAKAKAKATATVDLSVLEKGTKLQAKSDDGKWYAAQVVATSTKRKADPIKINWVGYTAASDVWVGADSLKSALLKPGGEKSKATEKKPKVEPICDIGIIGSGVMGSNLGLNIADKKDGDRPFEVAMYDVSEEQVKKVMEQNSSYKNFHGFGGKDKLKEFIMALKKPRKVIMLVPAGKITDDVIADVSKHLTKGDIIMDVGNANFRDQIRRAAALEKRGLRFLGMGVSGGAEGARKGPAFFPGGTLSVWEDVKHIIEAAAAKASDGRPCATMNGKGGAGSCVKMYHNAGEYAVLQIWSEVYEVMKAYGVAADEQAKILESWKTRKGGRYNGFLDSYMLDITIEVVKARDSAVAGGADDGSLLVEKTMDKTDSKGTGLWSVTEALDAGVPCPSLAAGLVARQMSMLKKERITNAGLVKLPAPATSAKWSKELEEDLYWATAFSIMASYAQMFQCLRKMDQIFEFGLKLPATIATFRAGCILQGFLLEPMTKAFEENPDLSNLCCAFEPEITGNLFRFKRCIGKVATETNCTVPALLASMDYIQTMFLTEIPSAQCVSLQRDVFGRHGFERLDKEGRFNENWRELMAGGAKITSATSAVTSSTGK